MQRGWQARMPQLSQCLLWEVWMVPTSLHPSVCLVPPSADTDWCVPTHSRDDTDRAPAWQSSHHGGQEEANSNHTHTSTRWRPFWEGRESMGLKSSGWEPLWKDRDDTWSRPEGLERAHHSTSPRPENSRQRKQQAQKPAGKKAQWFSFWEGRPRKEPLRAGSWREVVRQADQNRQGPSSCLEFIQRQWLAH